MASNGFMLCEVLSVTKDAATLTWKTAQPGKIEMAVGSTREVCNSSGHLQRYVISRLRPDTEYTVRLAPSRGPVRELWFRTLPQPLDEPLLTFAIVADPHVSFGKDCTHGRLFDESRQLLRETVEDVNAEGIQLVILPGDITEDGLEDEMREAKNILDDLNCPCFPVFGDHELVGNTLGRHPNPEEQRAMWCDIFGRKSTFYAETHHDMLFLALDSSTGSLGGKQLRWLGKELTTARCDSVVMASHRGLFPNPALTDDECIAESSKLMQLLGQHSRVKAVFVGHKNVPSRCPADGAWQFACPQICEFPCGYLVVKMYDDLWTYSFRPIRSDELMDKSFAQCLESGEAKWHPQYRIGRPEGRNGVLEVDTSSF